ncbi:MAG: hypothetical protein LBJ73_02460 [Rickettsiales bacterium]|jgi:hypothetical protein|nr:hypothetical protein [Rickettsiales bacterium]
MRKAIIFALLAFVCIGVSDAAVRDNNAVTRAATPQIVTQPRTQPATQKKSDRASGAVKAPATNASSPTTARVAVAPAVASRAAATTRDATNARPRGAAAVSTARSVTSQRNSANGAATTAPARATVARAAATTAMSETRTGAEYETCKNAYFTCMDQFCRLKNDDYRRCSCSDRVYEFDDVRTVIQDAGTKLTEFTEGLNSVGMSAAQATAMRTASEGENALTSDGSASKALLQAIMNSIRGGDTNVGGKFSELNSINISFDTANAFGMTDAGQAIAAYNGKNLYSAIYGQCRNAVRADCNDASLQRAVTAYLMAVEQDCNTVQASITETKKSMTAAVREGGAMLDLARVENRQKHNADDMTACLNNVEKSVLSEEVCGANYHKCLDNGEFIDITTGKPIAGVVKFHELEKLLTFNEDAGIANQKLSKVSNNRTFVLNFEKRVKKFAEPALDKCAAAADDVWSDYLDKAMLDIYYAQKSKVSEIRQGCFDFVSACYMNGDTALTTAMKSITTDASIVLQPNKITLNAAVCTKYVASCDNMFNNIVRQYVENRQSTDTLAACRAVVKQCFDKFGGANYENFYYPFSGLFDAEKALDWFTLCDGKSADDGECTYKSECAKQLSDIQSCSSAETMKQVFGGFDLLPFKMDEKNNRVYDPSVTDENTYGLITIEKNESGTPTSRKLVDYRAIRTIGVATEIYYQIISILNTQCNNILGRFVELQSLKPNSYDPDNRCLATFLNSNSEYNELAKPENYGIGNKEDMCPSGYSQRVATESWGVCLCWENGARRSRWGTSVKCVAELPVVNPSPDGQSCLTGGTNSSGTGTNWCSRNVTSANNQVCPWGTNRGADGKCEWDKITDYDQYAPYIPLGI